MCALQKKHVFWGFAQNQGKKRSFLCWKIFLCFFPVFSVSYNKVCFCQWSNYVAKGCSAAFRETRSCRLQTVILKYTCFVNCTSMTYTITLKTSAQILLLWILQNSNLFNLLVHLYVNEIYTRITNKDAFVQKHCIFLVAALFVFIAVSLQDKVKEHRKKA